MSLKFFLVAGFIVASLSGMAVDFKGGNNNLEKKLFKFENPGDLKSWNIKQGVKVDIDEKDGRKCVRVFFPKYQGLETRWPCFFTRDKEGLPNNWSQYDLLTFDVFLDSNTNSEFSVLIKDKNDKKYYQKPSLEPGRWTSVNININKDWIDAANIRELNIYQSHLSFDETVYISNIRLKNSLDEKAELLAAEYEKIGDRKSAGIINSVMSKLKDNKMSLQDASSEYDNLYSSLRAEQKKYLTEEFLKRFPSARFAVVQSDTMDKVLPQAMGINAESVPVMKMAMAKNEVEAIQALVIPLGDTELEKLSVEIQPFKLADDPEVIFNPRNITAAPLGFVETKKIRTLSSHIGFYPDPILEFKKDINVKKDEVQPYWIKFKTDSGISAGIYKGGVLFKTGNNDSITIPIEVNVWNFELPKTGHLKFVTSVYGSALLPKRNLRSFYDYILDNYRMNPFSIYNDNAYGEPLFPDIGEYLKKKSIGLNFVPILYLKLPRQALHKCSPEESKEKWAKMTPEEKKRYPEEWKKKTLDYLDKRVPELKKAGLWDFAYCYGFDEALPDEWEACADLCKAIREKYPDIKIISTAYDQSYGTQSVLGDALTGWIPVKNKYNYKLAEKIRKNGKEVWWYDIDMTIDKDTLSDIRALLGSRSFANNVDGFLVWTVNRWYNNKKPITEGPYTNWNPESFPEFNGGGSYFCAGPDGSFLPTIRAEAIRDGLEDYEYFYLLEKLSSALSEDNPLRKDAESLLSSIKKGEGIKSEELRDLRNRTGNLIEKIISGNN